MSQTGPGPGQDAPAPGAPGAPTGGTAARRAQQAARKQGRPATPAPAAAGSGRAGAGVDEPAGPGPGPARSAPTAVSRRALDPDRLVALEEERDFLLGSLDDLEREHDAGDVDDHDYEALKDDYTARAAGVLRAIENRQAVMAGARAPRRRGRTWAVAAAVLLVAVVAGVVMAQASGRRLPGDTVSGDIRQNSRQQMLQAQQLLGEGKLLDAIKIYDNVLAEQPANAEALTYKGWLLVLTARNTQDPVDQQVLLARAGELLDQALTVNPNYADAHVFRAILRKQQGRNQEALADLAALKPDDVPVFMTQMVDGLRKELEAGSSGTTPGSTPGTTRAP